MKVGIFLSLSIWVIILAVAMRIYNGSAGWLALLTIPASLYIMGIGFKYFIDRQS